MPSPRFQTYVHLAAEGEVNHPLSRFVATQFPVPLSHFSVRGHHDRGQPFSIAQASVHMEGPPKGVQTGPSPGCQKYVHKADRNEVNHSPSFSSVRIPILSTVIIHRPLPSTQNISTPARD